MVAGRLGERVDALLRDLQPVAVAEVTALRLLDCGEAAEHDRVDTRLPPDGQARSGNSAALRWNRLTLSVRSCSIVRRRRKAELERLHHR